MQDIFRFVVRELRDLAAFFSRSSRRLVVGLRRSSGR